MTAASVTDGALWERLPAADRSVQLLQAASVRPSDAYLFVGPDRTKSEAARVFAAAILCPGACGSCEICRRTVSGLHPDVQIFEPEGYTFPVELIRQIVTAAAQTPMESGTRVFILEEADRIAERSQNALLKALEEPGRSVTWILTADTLEPLLPTILSRCQIIEFPPLGDDAIVRVLESRLGLNREKAVGVTKMAAGSLEKAVKLATDERAGDLRTLALKAAADADPRPRRVIAVAEAVAGIALDMRASLEAGHKTELAAFDESIGKGRGAAGGRKKLVDRHKRALRRAETDVYLDFLSWLGSAYRDLAAAACGAPSHALVYEESRERIGDAAKLQPASFSLEMAETCAQAQLAIRENANPLLMLESTLLRAVILRESA